MNNDELGKLVFVDREKDFERIQQVMGDVEASRGALIMVSGEAGIGKSILARKVEMSAEKRNWTVMSGNCLFGEGGEPYLPFVRAINEHLKKVRKKAGGDDRSGQGIERVSTLPMGLIGVVGSADERETSRPTTEFKMQRDRMFESVSTYLERSSKDTPVLFFLDDLQWADNATIHLLYYLARSLRDDRVLLLGAYRPDEVERGGARHPLLDFKRRLERESLIETLTLGRFQKEETAELVKVLTKAEISNDIVKKIFEETEGNPYYIEEFVKTLKEKGAVIEGKGMKEGIDPGSLEIPTSIVGLINQRLDYLDDDMTKVLEHGTVIGHEFRYDILLRSTELEEDVLVDVLDRLITNRILVEEEEGGSMVYRFTDKLVREVVRQNMSRVKQRVLHKKVAHSIEEIFKDRTELMVYPLANHYSKTSNILKTLEYTALAGEKALRSYAFEEARGYLETALDMITKLEDVDDIEAREAHLSTKLGTAVSLLGDWRTALTYHNEALKLCPKGSIEEAAIHRAIGEIDMTRAEWQHAILEFDKSMRICQEIGDIRGLGESYRGLSVIYWRSGDHDQVMAYANRAIAEATKIGDDRLIGIIQITIGNSFNEGQESYDEALEYYEKALAKFDIEKDPDQISRIYNNLGDAYMKKEEWEKAIEYFEKCLEFVEISPIPNIKAYGIANIGICYIRMGEYDKAPPYIERGLKIFMMLDNRVMIPRLYQYKGRAACAKGKYDIAELFFMKAIEMQEDLNLLAHLADTYLQYGKMLKKQDRMEKAELYLGQALELFEKIGSKALVEVTKKEIER